jgi:hypothetical protein
MIDSRTIRRRVGDEEEKPFWISFADLMSALMVLFLVVMSAALVSITKAVNDQTSANDRRQSDIEQIVRELGAAAKRFDGITVNAERRVIDFGDRARFAISSSYLDDGQRRRLRSFVPEIVEGFTDRTGKYLENLNLSLQRSARVLCSMFELPSSDESPFTDAQRQQIQQLFLVGGFSSNAAKATNEESRRVEMRLEFLAVGESRPPATVVYEGDLGKCLLP